MFMNVRQQIKDRFTPQQRQRLVFALFITIYCTQFFLLQPLIVSLSIPPLALFALFPFLFAVSLAWLYGWKSGLFATFLVAMLTTAMLSISLPPKRRKKGSSWLTLLPRPCPMKSLATSPASARFWSTWWEMRSSLPVRVKWWCR